MKQIIDNILTAQWLEREVAFFIDIIICCTLTILPKLGIVLAIIYFFMKDALPWSFGRSLGKSIYGLKVITTDNEPNTLFRRTIVRNLIMIVPILNIIDIYYFISSGNRLADEWTGTKVIKEEQAQE